MSTRERMFDDNERKPRVRLGQPGADERIDAARSNAQQLLNAADEAISKALSSDSEAFLKATRQQGGE